MSETESSLNDSQNSQYTQEQGPEVHKQNNQMPGSEDYRDMTDCMYHMKLVQMKRAVTATVIHSGREKGTWKINYLLT